MTEVIETHNGFKPGEKEPAYPAVIQTPNKAIYYTGMDLRDAFAMASVQGTLANDVCMREMVDGRGYVDFDLIADRGYTIADAMLKRRQS